MIAIEVEFLTGRYVATRFNDRGKPEWPPHPARLFSALVATLSEHEELDPAGRRALEWLEQQGAPRVFASAAAARRGVAAYVPENTTRVLGDWSSQEKQHEEALFALAEAERNGDTKAVRRAQKAVERTGEKLAVQMAKAIADDGKHNRSACATALEMLPEHRGKLPRALPSVTPEQPGVRFVWPDAMPDADTRQALSELARRVVRLGHSSSLIACRIMPPEDERDDPAGLHAWVPSEDGDEILRTVEPGQLVRLERAHARHRGVEPRVLPAHYQRYRRARGGARRELASSVFGEWLVLREIAPGDGRRLGLQLTRTENVTRALRGALLHHAEDPPPAVLSGHAPDGSPLEQPHAAFLALPDVGSRYASGAILGVALVLPRAIEPGDRQSILRALGRWTRKARDAPRLRIGRNGVMLLERIVDQEPRKTLTPQTWSKSSYRWASVTPVALDENPGDLSARDPAVAARAAERAEAIVARSCERIGLPRPAWVQVMRRSLFAAAPAARRFMPFPRQGHGVKRVCVHVEMRFDEPVEGPVLLGAGRYVGLGLCRPRNVRDA